MRTVTLPKGVDRAALRELIYAQQHYQRLREMRTGFIVAAMVISALVWVIAAWPLLLPLRVRGATLSLWFACSTGALISFVGCRRWLARTTKLFEALGGPDKETR